MPEIIFSGPGGRLEGRYHTQPNADAPAALILHPHPAYGGTMNNKVVHRLYYCFHRIGFAVLRFNFRGIGRSQGKSDSHDDGSGELADAAAALDYLQACNPNSKQCWVAGFSYGAWIGMQLLMRRPEVKGFVAVAPPANQFDFSFLAPCPASGIIINGSDDSISAPDKILELVSKLKKQGGIEVVHKVIDATGHFFDGDGMVQLEHSVAEYIYARFAPPQS
ncbi:MAG: alpha/beta hydrolase [Rhodobacteraceae bacterium]|nr:alpha/beta hydrolase [Paracoccaceae bacterium]